MNKKICFIVPNLKAGGQERVVAELANNFANRKKTEAYIILFTKAPKHYHLDERISVFESDFKSNSQNKLFIAIRAFRFIRQSLKKIKPDSVLSLGEMWNSFTIVSCLNIKTDLYVSDRSRPSLKLHFFHRVLRKILYPSAKGIIAQTEYAKELMYKRIKHPNIGVIGNPIRELNVKNTVRQNIIINVGRFVTTKRQELLIKMFAEIEYKDWKLMFVGEGHLLDKCKNLVKDLEITKNVVFSGQVLNPDDYYLMSKIFAFTSQSEGFPNVLGEAQSAGLAVITFDFESGSRDLVENNISGIIIENDNIENYKANLLKLMEDEKLRETLSKNGHIKIRKFNSNIICDKYYNFLTGNNNGGR